MNSIQQAKAQARMRLAKEKARALRIKLWLQWGWIDSVEEGEQLTKNPNAVTKG